MGWGQVLGSALAGPIGGAIGGYAEDYLKGGSLFGGNSWGSSTSGSTSLFTNTLTNAAIGAWQGSQADKRSRAILNEQRSYDRDTLLRVREDAERAGFNPLTALRNGASNIGSNTYLNAPALSSADFIAQALMEGVDTGFNAPQRELDAETQRLQNELYRAQIGELQANTQYLTRSYGFGIPAVESYGVSSRETSGPSVTSADPLASGSVYDGNPDGVGGQRNLSTPFGWWYTDSRWSPASAAEEEGAEPLAWVWSAAATSWNAGLNFREHVTKPLYYNYLQNSSARRQERAFQRASLMVDGNQKWFADGFEWLK
jgi:hypothetical protein